jgi:4a-hydroxytetrahydrobiopterin dehydratase
VAARNFEICIDANDPAVLRPFWRIALGYVDEQTAEGAADLVDPDGVGPTVWFQQVPQVKTSKNRVHLDIGVQAQEREQFVEALVALGGRVVANYPRFTTLADPEGNELCVTTQ